MYTLINRLEPQYKYGLRNKSPHIINELLTVKLIFRFECVVYWQCNFNWPAFIFVLYKHKLGV